VNKDVEYQSVHHDHLDTEFQVFSLLTTRGTDILCGDKTKTCDYLCCEVYMEHLIA